MSGIYFEVCSADSKMFGFDAWCDENGIHYWITQSVTPGIVLICFDEDTDCIAAKLRWV